MAYIVPETSINPPPADPFQPPYYIKHVKIFGKNVHSVTYESLQNSLLMEYLITTDDHAGPQVIDKLMTISFKQEHRDQPDFSQEILKRGVELSGVMFRFLGHSNSQMKEKTCYLMAATVEEIHDLLAQFADFSKIPTTAKRARRIGLLFSTFNKSLSLRENEYEVIPDIKNSQYNFTDGCGFMSEDLAEEIKRIYRLDHVPSVVQIRYQGYKGVLVVLPELTDRGLKVQFRESMKKFNIPDDEVRKKCDTFGVVEYSKPYSKAFLNTQLTMILADNGTLHDHLFGLQRNYFDMLTHLCDDEEKALRYLMITGRKRTIQCLKKKGLKDPQVQQELQGLKNKDIEKMFKDEETTINNATRRKKISKLRVLVPKARVVFGVCDPYGELEYGEVFFQPTLPDEEKDYFYDATRVIVGRNPCYHPGDIRVLKLVHNKERYAHLYDCIVFPTKGRRPHPEECSGGDLDGDKFFVSWDVLIIPEMITKPFPYRDEEREHPYCPIGQTLRYIFLPISNCFGSFGRAHFQRIFGTEDEAIRLENIRQREELLNYFANFNNKLVARIDAIFMKYASRNGPSCETCVTLNKYFTDAIDMVGNSDAIEKEIEEMEQAYRKEETAHNEKKRKEPVYPRLIYPSRRIVRRKVNTPEGFLRQLKMDCKTFKKESFGERDECVWTTMEELSEEFVRNNAGQRNEGRADDI